MSHNLINGFGTGVPSNLTLFVTRGIVLGTLKTISPTLPEDKTAVIWSYSSKWNSSVHKRQVLPNINV